MIDVGDKIPSLDVEVVDRNEVKKLNFRDFLGKPLILYFYPKDDTPGCTKEACSFRDDIENFKKNNINVIGVSVQDEESHKKFIEKYNLNFPLVSDKDKKIAKEFGVIRDSGLAERVTFIFDKDGICKHVFKKVNPENHSKEVLEKLKELKLI